MFESLAICILASGCILAPQTTNSYIKVNGIGSSYEEARQNGFKKAIEIKVGSIVISETESIGNLITKDDIFLHSSGYVEASKVLRETSNGNRIILEMDVLVSPSNISNRILAKVSETKEINGFAVNDTVASYLKTKKSGDRLLNKVLDNYPVKKFDLLIKHSEFKLDGNRNLNFNIDFNTVWNKHFINALDETLQLLQEASKDENLPNVSITARSDSFFNPIEKRNYRINDNLTYAVVKNTVRNNPLYLKLTFLNNNKVLDTVCRPIVMGLLFEEKYNSVNFDTMYIINNKMSISLDRINLADMTNYRAELTNRNQC